MTITYPDVEQSVFRLFCGCGAFDVPCTAIRDLEQHTMRAHLRPPTKTERQPIDTVGHLRQSSRRVGTDCEILDHLAAREFTLVVDDDGRRWAMLLTGYGYTRFDGVWHACYRAEPLAPARRVAPEFTVWLDGWDAAHPSDDLTPPVGIPRPVSQLLAMSRGL